MQVTSYVFNSFLLDGLNLFYHKVNGEATEKGEKMSKYIYKTKFFCYTVLEYATTLFGCGRSFLRRLFMKQKIITAILLLLVATSAFLLPLLPLEKLPIPAI